MHTLLKRQLKRCFGDDFKIPDGWQGFINVIDKAYHEFDDDRIMLERSLELNSQELLQANSVMRAIFQASPDLLFRLGEDGTILDIKAGSDGDFVLDRQKIFGKRIQDIPDKNVSEQFQKAVEHVARRRETICIEYSLRLEGKESLYEARLMPLFEKQILVIIRNITDRKHAEAAIQERLRLEEQLSKLAATAPGFAEPFDVVSACEQLAGLRLNDWWSPPQSVPPVQPVDRPWSPPPSHDLVRGEAARLDGDGDGVVAILGLHRLGAVEQAVRAGADVTAVLVTGEPAELAPLARLVVAELAGCLREAFPPSAWPRLRVVCDDSVAAAAGVASVSDETEVAVRIANGRIVARSEGPAATAAVSDSAAAPARPA